MIMDKKSSIILSVGILLSSIIFSIAVYCAVDHYSSSGRTVSVKGLAEREVQADRVIAPFVFKTGGNNLRLLYIEVKEKNKVIENFLIRAGIEESEITISAPSVYDASTQQYNSNSNYIYVVTSVITVCTDKVQTIIDLQKEQGQLIEAGIATEQSWEYPTEFSFNGLNEIKPEMIEEATKNARAAAEKFAQDSGSKLGKIKRASQGQFSISNRDSNTPYIKNVRVVTSVDYQLDD